MDGRAGSASPSAPASAAGAKLDAAGGSGGGEVLGAANGAVMTPSASVGAAMDTLNADADASHEDDERVEGSDDDDQVEGGVQASVEEGEEMDDEALARMLQQQEHGASCADWGTLVQLGGHVQRPARRAGRGSALPSVLQRSASAGAPAEERGQFRSRVWWWVVVGSGRRGARRDAHRQEMSPLSTR